MKVAKWCGQRKAKPGANCNKFAINTGSFPCRGARARRQSDGQQGNTALQIGNQPWRDTPDSRQGKLLQNYDDSHRFFEGDGQRQNARQEAHLPCLAHRYRAIGAMVCRLTGQPCATSAAPARGPTEASGAGCATAGEERKCALRMKRRISPGRFAAGKPSKNRNALREKNGPTAKASFSAPGAARSSRVTKRATARAAHCR